LHLFREQLREHGLYALASLDESNSLGVHPKFLSVHPEHFQHSLPGELLVWTATERMAASSPSFSVEMPTPTFVTSGSFLQGQSLFSP
jgi:hypothetical protein